MIKFIFLTIFLSSTLLLSAQISDDFSDGNFNSNPVWIGNTDKFEVNSSKQLHLKSTGVDTSCLVSLSTYSENCEWRFWTKLSFNTSANNNGRVYLMSDNSNISGNISGYFIQLGDAADSISLCRQVGNVITKIVTCKDVKTSATVNTLRFKVIRKLNGLWELYCDKTGGSNYLFEGSGMDNTFILSNYFGVFCKYTSSNATKFYFDDFYIGNIQVDSLAPALSTIKVIDNRTLQLSYSEAIGITCLEKQSNYLISNNGADSIRQDVINPAIIRLYLTKALENGENYQIRIDSVVDLSGNIAKGLSGTFSFYQPKAFDIVINEIMADPTPAIGLPESEFIELFNRTDKSIDLTNWQIILGGNAHIFSESTIAPNGYLILCPISLVVDFQSFGCVLGFSSLPITNAGESIVLKDNMQHIISSINFTDSWYGSSEKAAGGWSLEQINPNNACDETVNWTAATNFKGGTPGSINSVNNALSANRPANLIRVGIADYFTIQLYFDKKIDTAKMLIKEAYTFDNGLGYPVNVYPQAPDYKSVKLVLPSIIENKKVYTVSISDTLTDCMSNKISKNQQAKFALPENVAVSDIIINEVLPDPFDGGVDFIEIYNRSSKILDLSELQLCSMADDSVTISSSNVSNSYLFFPGEYLVLTSDPAKVKSKYTILNPNAFLQMSNFPAYNIDGGTVLLKNYDGKQIDGMRYHQSMQFPLLQSSKGVSYERLNFACNSYDSASWHSASEVAGFATPGYKNSQYTEYISTTTGNVSVQPDIFSPDNDGKDDILSINYSFDNPGFVVNIQIFDANGRLSRKLVSNELADTKGSFYWDGKTDKNEIANIGIYIVYFEAFNKNGKIIKDKKSAVVARK